MPSTYGERSRSRPLGVTVLCVLGSVGVFFSFFAVLGVTVGGPFLIFAPVGLALVVGKAVVLYGLWTLQYWGYKWALVFYGLSAVFNLVTLSIFGLIIDAVIVAYLLSRADHFR